MYRINTMPGKAAAKKGHADFPGDFSRLRPGEVFTAWRVSDGWEIETILGDETLFVRLQMLDGQVSRERAQELQYIISFAEEGCFDTEAARSQLRGLWTAYCLHHNLDMDTSGYDHDLMNIWAQISATEGGAACGRVFDSFDSFMCAGLV